MPPQRFHVSLDDAELTAGFKSIREEMSIADQYQPEVLAEAEAAAQRGPVPPPGVPDAEWVDRRDLHLVAIDPPGSRDLDQAYGAERIGERYRVYYAIADLAAFVEPGSALEADSLERGVTMYAPDRRVSLHPDVINENAASLLPGQPRPSVLWEIDLDSAGELIGANASRSTVQVDQAMTYRDAQAEIASETCRESLVLLREVGEHRQRLERERGAVSLNLPSQEVTRDSHGHLMLSYDETLPVENWNAQISLLTGIAAAGLMIDAGVGLLRTLPTPEPETIEGLRRTARGLRVDWPESRSYADQVRDLDPSDPQQVALLMRSARGLRGAGYAAFTSTDAIPKHPEHSAIASTYAHVTAPLRRVCDRYANEILLSICSDREPPEWALATLPELPQTMGQSRQRENALERAIVDYMEAMMLAPSVGAQFDATVVNHRRDDAVISIADPAVVATVRPKPQLGQEIRVKLLKADPVTRTLRFERTD